MIGAAIIAYFPEEVKFKQVIEAVLHEVDIVVVYDNGGANYHWLSNTKKILLLGNNKNVGIRGLNVAAKKLIGLRAEYILILDQDSILPKNYVGAACKYLKHHESKYTCSPAINETERLRRTQKDKKSFRKKTFVIGSGLLMSADVWLDVGGFDENFFLDCVDIDWSLRAARKGVQHIVMNNFTMNHSLGEGFYRFFGFKISRHMPFRHYLYFRNITIILMRKKAPFFWKIKYAIKLPAQFFILSIVSDYKLEEFKAFYYGIKDGFSWNGRSLIEINENLFAEGSNTR